jgi:hypothetical protein
MNRATFNTYVETQLAPTLRKGDVVILDNLSSHKSQYAAERCCQTNSNSSSLIGLHL